MVPFSVLCVDLLLDILFELLEVGVVGGAGWLLAAATAAKLPTE